MLLRRAALPGVLGLAAAACNPLLGIDDYQFTGTSGAGGQTGGTGGTGGTGATGGQTGGSGGGPQCEPGEKELCYSGPKATRGVGVCQEGTWVCDENGQWGPCEGEVLPQPETCEAKADENCDGQMNEGCFCTPGTTALCYTGPPGTQGVAGCKTGSYTCQPDGNGYGPCVGDVTPATEICGTPADESCDGLSGCSGAHGWSKRFGGSDDQFGDDIAGDVSGDVVTTGHFEGQLDFGGGALAGFHSMYVTRLGPAGQHVWSKNIGGSCMYCSARVRIDPPGDVVLAGGFNGTLDFGGGDTLTNDQEPNVFVAKLAPGGSPLWSKQFGGAGAQHAQALAVGANGAVVIAGPLAGELDFGGGPLSGTAFVAMLDAAGDHLWSRGYTVSGAPSSLFIRSVAVDAAGNVVIAGGFNGTVDLGLGPLTSSSTDMFVAKLTPDGAPVWSKQFGGPGAELLYDAAVDPAGDVVVTGYFTSTLDLGPADIMTAGAEDIFVAKLNTNGNQVWTKTFGSAGIETGDYLAVDGAGNVVLAGYFYQSTFDFGGPPLTNVNPAGDTYLAKLDPQGNHIWSKVLSHPDATASMSNTRVRTDASGSVLLTGIAQGPLDLGGGNLPGSSGWDVFVAKLQP